jgi:hypothetical protein
MPLIPIEVKLQRSLTFDQISKQFIGTDAEVPLTVINKGGDQASLKKGTRFRNQAGMIFRIEKSILVPQNGTMTVRAKADELDEYGEIIGERGNLPAGLQWEIPALSQADRKQLYGENRVPATGGKTAYRTVLQKADLDAAQRLLEQQLLADAKKQVDERVQSMQLTSGKDLRLLSSDQLVKTTFSGFVLPVQLLNQPVAAITAQGGLTYRVCAYDADAILDLVRTELLSHIADDKRPLLDTADLKHLNLRVFDYADDRSWIKATIELTATEQFILDPLTPAGARFDKKVRETVAGLSRQDALRIINNFPEVEKADISLWPPWDTMLPTILSNISIVTRS